MHLPKTLLLVLLTGLLTSKAQAALYAYFPLDSISGGTTANLASGGVAGTVNGTTISIVNDAVRGNVGYNSSTTAGNYISAGTTAIFNSTSNHTWSFWAKPATDQSNNAVIIGNRGNGDGVQNDSQWVKFTPSRFEFNLGANALVDYPDLRTGVTTSWQHYAIVKEGLNLRFYQNGTLVSSLNTTISAIGTPMAMNFQLFGDRDYTSEIWSGYLDDVALFNHALTASEISGLASGLYTPLTIPEPSKAGLAFAAFCLWGLRRKRAC